MVSHLAESIHLEAVAQLIFHTPIFRLDQPACKKPYAIAMRSFAGYIVANAFWLKFVHYGYNKVLDSSPLISDEAVKDQ